MPKSTGGLVSGFGLCSFKKTFSLSLLQSSEETGQAGWEPPAKRTLCKNVKQTLAWEGRCVEGETGVIRAVAHTGTCLLHGGMMGGHLSASPPDSFLSWALWGVERWREVQRSSPGLNAPHEDNSCSTFLAPPPAPGAQILLGEIRFALQVREQWYGWCQVCGLLTC